MADKATETVDVVSDEKNEKEIVDSPTKQDAPEDKEKNGDVCEAKNGKDEKADDVDSKEPEIVCPVKRKSAGGDAAEATPAEGVSPEKKAKLDEAPAADAESNGEAEVAA